MRCQLERLTILRIGAATVAAATVAAAWLPAGAQAQATRTWVSGEGDDVNPCSRLAPCKTLVGAQSKTAEGGEINALDSGGFGAVTITKALTVDLSPYLGGVLTNVANGISVNAGADDDVTLRGLLIDGLNSPGPAPPCSYAATNGIVLTSARSLRVEDVQVTRFANSAVQVTPSSGNPKVVLDDVDISNACANGVNAAPAAGQTVDVLIRGGTISNAGTAVRAADGSSVRLTEATIFGNAFGLVKVGTGVIETCGDNAIVGNGPSAAPTNGTATLIACDQVPPPPPPPPAVVVAPPPPPPPPPPVRCTVPKLTGLTLAKARTKLAKAHCRLGAIKRRATSRASRVGKVIAQGSTAGTVKAANAKIGVTIGKRS